MKILKTKSFQELSVDQWCWMWSAYWRLWPVLLRIKFKQLFNGMQWVTSKITIADGQVARRSSNSDVALKMHESVRLAARLHFYDAECLAKSIVLADMLNARRLTASVLLVLTKPADH